MRRVPQGQTVSAVRLLSRLPLPTVSTSSKALADRASHAEILAYLIDAAMARPDPVIAARRASSLLALLVWFGSPFFPSASWGVDCVFPSSAGPAPSKTTLSRSSTPPVRQTSRNSTPVQPPAAPVVPPAPAQPAAQVAPTPDVAEQLRLMNERLASLESALARASTLSSPASTSGPHAPVISIPSDHSQRHGLHAGASQAGSVSSPMTGVTPVSLNDTQHDGVGANAVETAGEAMAIEGLVDLGSAQGRNGDHASGVAGDGVTAHAWDSVKPDVLGRGIMTVEECDAEFDLCVPPVRRNSALAHPSAPTDFSIIFSLGQACFRQRLTGSLWSSASDLLFSFMPSSSRRCTIAPARPPRWSSTAPSRPSSTRSSHLRSSARNPINSRSTLSAPFSSSSFTNRSNSRRFMHEA